MKKIILIAAFFVAASAFGQIWTSFEEPEIFTVEYVDTGDATIAHDLLNNSDEPFVDFTSTGGELGFNASYSPYDTPGTGLTDGDFVGVTDASPSGSNPYPDGAQGYIMSDIDGNFILEFDPIDTGVNNITSMTMDYFIADTGYEGDGTQNETGSDRLRIYIKDLTNATEIDILDTTGNDINDLEIQGAWIHADLDLSPLIGSTVQLVIEARTNSAAEAFYFDNIIFSSLVGFENSNKDAFTLYPNPATNGYISIISESKELKHITVYDILGNERLNTSLSEEKLDISQLHSGVYILKIIQGPNYMTKKLIVK